MNFSDEEREALEAEYENVDPKLIQIQQLMELSAIRQLLQSQAGGESETSEVYQCSACKETIRSDNLKAHAVNEHSAPPDMPVEDIGLYELAEQ